MSDTKVTMVGDISIADYGREEYLDGAMMRFSVQEGRYPHGDTLAYFANAEDAEIFAKAKARKRRTTLRTSAQNGRQI